MTRRYAEDTNTAGMATRGNDWRGSAWQVRALPMRPLLEGPR